MGTRMIMSRSKRTKCIGPHWRLPVMFSSFSPPPLQCIIVIYLLLSFLSITATAFSDSFYFEVKENSPAQTYVGKIATKAGFTYRFNDDPVEFDLNAETGVILTTDVPLDRESKDSYSLVILSSSPTYPIEVKITVLDVNDNVPFWPPSINTNLSFSESAPVGTKVILDNAIDADSGLLSYRIEPVNELGSSEITGTTSSLPFKLNYNSSTSFLHLEVASKLDRELQSSYLLNITATDENDQSSFAIFSIRILDSNDNAPLFDHSDYSVSLNESMPKGASILQVHATDADEEDNENSRISYYLTSQDFTIDPKSGVIYTAHDGPIVCSGGRGTATSSSSASSSANSVTSPNSANECWLVVTVFAQDHGSPRQDGRTYVTAKIYDSNNHAPSIKFRHFSKSAFANVDEGVASGSVVAAVSVVDYDHGRNGQTSVALTGGNELGHFRLDTVSGSSHILKVNSTLDREKVNQYNLTVTAVDHGTPVKSSSASLLIFVQDSNDHSPLFERESYEAVISETQQQVGVFVAALRATDLDEGINAQIYYSLSGPNSHYFRIDANSGLVTTEKVINREEIDSFELKVTATDGGSNPKWVQTTLKVKVADVNDEVPQLHLLASSSHAQSKTSGSYELKVQSGQYLDVELSVKDDDLGNNGTVDVSILYDYAGLFRTESSISSSLVKLVSTEQLSNEQQHCDSYQLVLLAKDRAPAGAELTSLTTIHVIVLRAAGETDKEETEDDATKDALPVFYPRQYFARISANSVSENKFSPVSIIKLQVNDGHDDEDESSQDVTFRVRTEDSLPNKLFDVSEEGQLRLLSGQSERLRQLAPRLLTFIVDCLQCSPESSTAQVNVFIGAQETKLPKNNRHDEDYEKANQKYRFVVDVNTPSGSIVGQLEKVTDAESLHLVSGDLQGHFHLLDNKLILEQPLLTNQRKPLISTFQLGVVVVRASGTFQNIEVIVDVNTDDNNYLLAESSLPYHFAAPFEHISLREDVPAMYVLRRFGQPNRGGSSSANESTTLLEFQLLENPHDLFIIEGNELKLGRTIGGGGTVVRHSKKPISAILRVKIRASDKLAATRPSASAALTSARCQCSNELTLFISINSSSSSNRASARFSKRFYEFAISESTPINEQVFRLPARHIYDADSVSAAIVSGNVNNSFGILPNGQLYIRNQLDREAIDLFLLGVVLHDSALSTSNNASLLAEHALDRCQVLIRLTDVNDHAPIFEGHQLSGYHFSVPENVPKNFLLGRVSATDGDVDANSRLVYSIVKSYYSSYVQIDPQRGYLWSALEYDRETLPAFEITVQATDQPVDEQAFSTSVSVRVTVIDKNDNCPRIEVPANVTLTSSTAENEPLQGRLMVSEATEVGAVVAVFRAIDVDQESSITYQLIEEKNKSSTFALDLTGTLTLLRSLDRETVDNYQVTIEASDGQHQSRFELTILVDDVNDSLPTWVNPLAEMTELTVPENISIGSEILKLAAEDRDLGANGLFNFAIEPHQQLFSTQQKVFDVLGSRLVVVNHLDYEKIRLHLLNISLIESQSGRLASSRLIRINIENINDCPPVFVQRTDTEVVRVQENSDMGSKLLTLTATDCDQNDTLVYEIVRCNTHYHTHNIHDSNNCPLSLNAKSGEIININNLDREVIESINLELSVRDTAGHADKMKVIFIIEDVNDEKPMFISPRKILASKETISRPGALLGSVKAIDLDMGINSAVTYSLDSGLFDEYLELDRYLGTFKVKRSLEAQANSGRPLLMNVTATDGGGLSTTDSLQLIVRPELPYLQSEPVFIDLYENGPIGAEVARLHCGDQTESSPCQFHLINATDRHFQVDTWTGLITTVDLIDREAQAKRQLEVLIVSRTNLQHVRVHINVLDLNDNPPYLTNTSIAVHLSESVEKGTQVFDLSRLIADEDTNNKFDYQMINCSQCDGTFSLNRKTGVLTLQTSLDSEKTNKYRILFGVSDGIYLLTSIMDVIVDDENDNKPYFNQSVYVFSIEENTERGVLVGQVTAFDDDVSNRNLEYSVLSGTSELDAVLSVFSLDSRSGQITLSKRLDYEVDQSQYVFFVQASDGKYSSTPVKVIFKLINLPDNIPIFESPVYRFEVMENTLSDNAICVKATDADLQKRAEEVNTIDGVEEEVNEGKGRQQLQLKYSIEATGTNSKVIKEAFNINPSTGCIYVVKPLDREALSQLNLTVIADDGFFKSSTLVIIQVSDDNDCYPIFEKSTPTVLRIEENVPIDTVVATFRATDQDEAPNSYIKYEILPVSNAEQQSLPFVIGPIDGQLKVTGPIDRETVDHFEVIIRATDYGLKQTEFNCRIEVEDLIDNAPFFSAPLFELTLPENTSVGEYVLKLDAKDADLTDELNYKIIAGNGLGHFKVDDDWLVVAGKLNFEEISSYSLKINAVDRTGNLDTTTVRITIFNVMDERPVFLDSPYHVNWFENQLGVVDRFEALPDDAFPLFETSENALAPSTYSGHINYLLLNNYENSFRLNSSTGVLSVVKPIDREALSRQSNMIELKLIAFDTRSRLSSEGIVIVNIVDTNDNAPLVEATSYTFRLNENVSYVANTTVGQVVASDADEGDTLQYKLIHHLANTFSIDESGRIYTSPSSITFDREHRDEYHLTVRVSDSLHWTTVKVFVVIDDGNDCTPRIARLNGIAVPVNSAVPVIKLKLSPSQLNTLVEKRYPLIGVQVTDCDAGENGLVQLRMNNDLLYSVLSIDQTNGLIRADYKNINTLKEKLTKVGPSIGITLTDSSPLNQLSSSFTILFELTSSSAAISRERPLLKENFVELSVSELSKVESTLHRFEPLDRSSIDISIYAGDLYSHFAIVDNNRLVLKRSLDYELNPFFDLYLQVKGGQAKEYEDYQYIAVRVNVINENDNAPRFRHSLYNASILEEVEEEAFVVQVLATDLDSTTSTIKYKLINGKEKVPFRIDSETGNIWTIKKIDREMNASFRLEVSAEDEGGLTDTCTVIVTIDDKNDNPPRFTRLFRVNITENTPIGAFVIQVTSIDRDQSNSGYSNVSYDLLTQTDAFEIDRVTGSVYVSGLLDREEVQEYALTVSADDGSWKAQTTLTIYILDENDVMPTFEQKSYRFDAFLPTTNKDQANVSIGQVQAHDSDEGVNGDVNYRLKTRSKFFTIDAHSGEISMKKRQMWPKVLSQDLNWLNQYFLTVVATDRGLLPRSSEVQVLVRLFDDAAETSSNSLNTDVLLVVVPVDLANQTLLYTANSLLRVKESGNGLAVASYNQLLFSGASKLLANRRYRIPLDNGYSSELSIELQVTEANRYSPVFETQQHNSTTLREGPTEKGQLVERFTAIDKDESQANNLVTYSFNLTALHWNANSTAYLAINYRDKYPHLFRRNLTAAEIVANIAELAPVLSPFALNGTSGELTLRHSLDYELITRYSLLVVAADNAWYKKAASLHFDVLVGDIDDFFDYYPKSLRIDPSRPDPMSIGVVLVIFFFVVLILVISTSFFFYHNQKKNQHNHLRDVPPVSPRKHFLNSFSPYPPSSAHLAASQQNSASRAFAASNTNSRNQLVQQQQSSNGTVGRIGPTYNAAINPMANMCSSMMPPSSAPSITVAPPPPAHHHHPVAANRMSINNKGFGSNERAVHHQQQHSLGGNSNGNGNNNFHQHLHQQQQHHAPSPVKRPDLVNQPVSHSRSNSGHSAGQLHHHHQLPSMMSNHNAHHLASNVSVTNASESASVVATRIAQQGMASSNSIYNSTHNSNSEANYTDCNYSNILASAEHYDLENASSIAPSDIDIVYHYKGFRNHHRGHDLGGHSAARDHSKNDRALLHAPLSRLSPSVSEVSSVPRILTLQDLSPQVPPCPPVMNAMNSRNAAIHQIQRKQVAMNPMGGNGSNTTENSFNCSEYDGDTYGDIGANNHCNSTKKVDKNVFQRVW